MGANITIGNNVLINENIAKIQGIQEQARITGIDEQGNLRLTGKYINGKEADITGIETSDVSLINPTPEVISAIQESYAAIQSDKMRKENIEVFDIDQTLVYQVTSD